MLENLINSENICRSKNTKGLYFELEQYYNFKWLTIIKENGDEIEFQAKYFLSTLQKVQFDQLDSSIKTVLEKHPNLKSYYVAILIDIADPREDKKII